MTTVTRDELYNALGDVLALLEEHESFEVEREGFEPKDVQLFRILVGALCSRGLPDDLAYSDRVAAFAMAAQIGLLVGRRLGKESE